MIVVAIIIVILVAFCAYTLITGDLEEDARRKQQAGFDKKLDYLHGCRRDRFEFAGKYNTPYKYALEYLDRLERGEYPLRSNDGKIFDLYNIEDYIAERIKDAKYLGKGRWYSPAIFVNQFDEEARENFRQGKVTIGKDITMYEKARLMTFAEARGYMNTMIRKEMDRIWKNS